MSHLSQELAARVRKVIEADYGTKPAFVALANDVITDEIDFEHIITFLDESPSSEHRQFASRLRTTFETVLRERLETIETEQQGTPDHLYAVLLDLYNVPHFPERLNGFLTLNYDHYLTSAIDRSRSHSCDPGITFGEVNSEKVRVRALQLHGAFDWNDTWPVTPGHDRGTLWIPPGIQKAKLRYPFNLLWGLARELLDCEVVRIVGCQLSSNDWDLMSLLFTTKHVNSNGRPYTIEIIDAPAQAATLQTEHQYLDVRSLFEIDGVGSRLIGEVGHSEDVAFEALLENEQQSLIELAGYNRNWFRLWLKYKIEDVFEDLDIDTPSGEVARFLEEY